MKEKKYFGFYEEQEEAITAFENVLKIFNFILEVSNINFLDFLKS